MSTDFKGFFCFSRTAVLLLLGALLSACAARIYTEQDRDVDLSHYHSYAWVSPPPSAVHDPILDSQILEARVRRSAEADLNRRGYAEVAAAASPDFIVTYHTVSKQKIESGPPSFSLGVVDAFPYGFAGAVVPLGGDVETRDEGTLMLDVIDGHSKRLVWRGWTKGTISTDNYSDQAVAAAVQQILAKFPSG